MNDFQADAIISQLLLLDSQDGNKVGSSVMKLWEVDATNFAWNVSVLQDANNQPESWLCHLQDIKLFINSPGGSVTAGMGIYDAMQVCTSMLDRF